MKKKEDLIKDFFSIRGNEQLESLTNLLDECELHLKGPEADGDIRNLVNVINALRTYFMTGSKDEARSYVEDLYERLVEDCIATETNLSFFEMRLLGAILFIEKNLEKAIKMINYCLEQLEIYKFEDEYAKTKMVLNLRLIILLVDSKIFDKHYQVKYDEIISGKISETIRFNLQTGLNNAYYVACANIYKGIFLKDEDIIYTGLLLLKHSEAEENLGADELVKSFIKRYDIKIDL